MCYQHYLSYGSQTWATTRKEEAKIETTYNAKVKSKLNVRLKDKIRIKEMSKKMRNARNSIHEVRGVNGMERGWTYSQDA